MTDTWTEHDTRASDGSIRGGHGGGDQGIMEAFIAALAANDASLVLTGSDETLDSHLMVFAAETSRRENQVVEIQASALRLLVSGQ